MHADLHNIDRLDALSPIVSAAAGPNDHDLLQASGWPVNLILYLERNDRDLHWAITAWAPSSEQPVPGYSQVPVLMPWHGPMVECA